MYPVYFRTCKLWSDCIPTETDINVHIRYIQSTLFISNSELLRDIRNKSNNQFHKCIRNLTPGVTDVLKILWKRGEIAP